MYRCEGYDITEEPGHQKGGQCCRVSMIWMYSMEGCNVETEFALSVACMIITDHKAGFNLR